MPCSTTLLTFFEWPAQKGQAHCSSRVIIGLTGLVATALAMSVIDGFGRKKLLLIGAAGMSFCLAVTAFAFY
jgi:hypothetical protein